MNDCLFCKIVAGEIPCDKVDESENVLAFRDIDPKAPTHVLLIPKAHVVESAAQIGPDQGALMGELFQLAGRIAKSEGLTEGWRLVTNIGAHAGQTVFHLHFHLLGGRPMQWPPG